MKKTDILQTARNVIAQQVSGLEALEDALGESFIHAVELIQNCKGRLIISGMGKSGHVARKIAATFASTGTPSHFVHPAEASHGDLGMITPDDVVMLLSNSGETAELQDIITYCTRFSIPIIAIVRRETSILVEAAKIAFILPAVAESSPVNAPTTSTTMMMAWGDALAVSVLYQRGFTNEDFGIYHPGGKLGSQLAKAESLMKPYNTLPIVSKSDGMDNVLIIMTEKSLGCALVAESDQTLIGLITDGDLRRHMSNNLIQQSAEKVMTPSPITILPSMLASEALGIMNQHGITSLCVTDNGNHLLGLLHIHDVLRAGIV